MSATFSLATSSCACFTASAGCPLSSRNSTSTLRPSTPPLALISSTAISTAARYGPVNGAPIPLKELISPILIGPCAAAGDAPAASAVSMASVATKRVVFIGNGPPRGPSGGGGLRVDAALHVLDV